MEPGFLETPLGAASYEAFMNDHVWPDDVPGKIVRVVCRFYEVCDACKTSDKPWKCQERHGQPTPK